MAENEAGDKEYQARTQEEMDKYTQIVQSAVGYNQERGDQIKVENIQFDRSLNNNDYKISSERKILILPSRLGNIS